MCFLRQCFSPNGVHVGLEVPFLAEAHPADLTTEVLLVEVDIFNVLLDLGPSGEGLATKFTLVFPFLEVDVAHVLLELALLPEALFADIALEVLLIEVDGFYVAAEACCQAEGLPAGLALISLFQVH